MAHHPSLRPALEAGLAAHQRGDVEAAKAAFQSALAIAPDDPDALNFYGVSLLQSGQAANALVYLQRAAQLRRNDPSVVGNLAHTYFALKRYDEARELFRKASRLDPRTLQFPLGTANSLAMQGKFDVAEDLLQKLALRFPESALIWFNLGNVQRDLQHPDQAMESFRRTLVLAPQMVDARNNLAGVLHATLRFEEAEREYRECVKSAPDYLLARCNLASVVIDLGRFDEAAGLCRDIIRLAPELPQAHSFLGATLSHQGRLPDALASLATAVRLAREDAKITQTYAGLLAECGDFNNGMRWFARAMALDPRLNSTHQLLAYALLGHGCMSEGWAEYMHRPWPATFNAEHPHLALARSLPPDLGGRYIYLIREQGLGDEIFFLRFAPLLHAQGTRITYCASSKIRSLLTRVPCLAQVLDEITPPADADANMLVGDLPHAMSSSPSSPLPAMVDAPALNGAQFASRFAVYWPPLPPPLALAPHADRVAEMRDRLAQAGPGPYFGLTWRGGTPPREQRAVIWALYKEVGIAPLGAALRDIPGTVIALQRNPVPAELDALSRAIGRPVHNFSALNEDLEGMLALLALIDEYIGVSSTNMHLRAGVGKTARGPVPNPPDWRWMMNHARTSPWFPDFPVYRQSLHGDWNTALAELTRDINPTQSPANTD